MISATSFAPYARSVLTNGCGKHATLRGDASLGGAEQNLWIPPVLKELMTKKHIASKMQYRSLKVGARRQRYFSAQTAIKQSSNWRKLL